jgi:cobalt-zinc-cadmium efflux system protein
LRGSDAEPSDIAPLLRSSVETKVSHDHSAASHAAHDHVHLSAEPRHAKRLAIMLGLTALLLVAEAITGWLVHSLALLSDAAHMLTDTTALAISLVAIHLGRRPADPKRTFGYRRFEILAAAANALMLFGIAIYIFVEAWQRFVSPPDIQTGPMLAVAVLGLVINLVGIFVLRAGQDESLNVHGAYLEVLSDALGSVGVIAAALVIRFTGWKPIDPILAVAIGLWVLPRTWRLLNRSLHILLEGAPEGVDLQAIQDELAALPHVQDVHDLHVWSLTSGEHSLSVHLAVAASDLSLVGAAREIACRHGIEHTTIQLEEPGFVHSEQHVHRPLQHRSD